MPGRAIYNGALSGFNLEYEAGPSGDIQVVTEKQLVDVDAVLADSQFTVGATAVTLVSKNLPASATRALISVEGDAIRWWDDGKTPSSANGHMIKPVSGDTMYFWVLGRARLLNWSMIRVTTDATVRVSYYQ